MIPTFENFQQGQSRLHEGSDDYVASFRTKTGKNIIVTLKGWGKLSDTQQQYEEEGFEIYEALSEVFNRRKLIPKEIIVKY